MATGGALAERAAAAGAVAEEAAAFPAGEPGAVRADRPVASRSDEPVAGRCGEPLVRRWRVPYRVDVRLTLSVHQRGRRDPTLRIDRAGAVWRTSLTPDGPGTVRIVSRGVSAAGGAEITAAAWGAGAGWLLDTLPDLLGAADASAGFFALAAQHPLLRRLALRFAATRIGRSARVLEALVPAVLEQKVLTIEAHRAWRWLLARYGGPAPGPAPDGMRVFPPPRTWAAIPPWEWHRAGVEAVRARTIAAAVRVAGRVEETLGMEAAAAGRRLQAIPGIGPWTVAEVRQRAAGDPDAVSVGDANLPEAVGWALAGRVVDDAGMLALLAPYAGQRYRVTRLIELSGLRPPRRAPRLPVRDYRRF